ncbi:MAG: hypothetical protein RBT69_00230 [Spirochaetia bacterium]|nr:hypothetical protein [Spirochaetia bacterium]
MKKELTPGEKNIKHYFNYAFYNGFGAGFIAKGPVMLLALYFGASNIQLGYLSSIIHSAGISLLLLPVIFGGKNTVRVHATIWVVRGVICMLYFILPFVDKSFAVYTIMIVYTIYCFAREIGSVLNQITRKYISSADNTGEIIGLSSVRFHRSSLIARAASFFFTSIEKIGTLTALLVLQFVGIIANTAAALQLFKLKCPEKIEPYSGRNMLEILKESVLDREKRLILLLKWLILSADIMMGLLVAFYSRELRFEANLVFAFLILQSLAAITAAKSLAVFSDRTGSSPLILLSSVSLACLSIFWIFISSGIIFPLFLGFITCFFLHFNNYLIMRLIINKMLPGKEVTFMSMINFTASFFSFIIGLYSGALIDIYIHFFGEEGNSFTFVFISTAVISVVNASLALRLLRIKSEKKGAAAEAGEREEDFSRDAAVSSGHSRTAVAKGSVSSGHSHSELLETSASPGLPDSGLPAKRKKKSDIQWWEITGYL